MKNLILLAVLGLVGCGGDSEPNEGEAPPTVIGGGTGDVFALENGVYFFSNVTSLNDGCGRNPLDPKDPLTAVPFNLKNDGHGQVTIDRCIYQGASATGHVQDNNGSLQVLHNNRRDGNGAVVAEYLQECQLDVKVTADNTLKGSSSESQRNRNAAMKKASGVNASECTTSYQFVLTKR